MDGGEKMLIMYIVTFCKKCGQIKDMHEIGNGKPCKYCGGEIISQSANKYKNTLKEIQNKNNLIEGD